MPLLRRAGWSPGYRAANPMPRVTLRTDQLAANCTCPYGGTCKHAIAVALAYLNRPEQVAPLPVAPASDPRLVLLERQAAAAAEPIRARSG
ncbi:MAG: hypothetical protein HC828_02540, partial [Blastochloris sp.]|nr:hypothetical protein [Blastochloris sp.]